VDELCATVRALVAGNAELQVEVNWMAAIIATL